MLRSHRKLRNFYRFITSDTDQTSLKIPKKFTRDHRKQILLNNNVLLIVSDDKVWSLGWTVSDNGKLWLQKGWPEFYQHYCLNFGHLLHFKHLGKSIFHVRIFDPRYQELYNLQPEKNIKNNRSFKVTVRESYLESSMLYVPVRFYRRYLSGNKKSVRCVLQMAQGGSWGGVKCRVYDGYAKLCGQNWKRFSDENHLCVGDVCVFELINAVENVMRVTVSRAC
ncbi:putative transcription factor B3-Domain family [Helianthus debilis subsp. tardiflorus]